MLTAMRLSRWLLLCIFACAGALHGPSSWTPLWNGRDLDGWTTWMRQPEPGSDVPGLTKDASGKYTEPIGSGRDPLQVFTVLRDVDDHVGAGFELADRGPAGEPVGVLCAACRRIIRDEHGHPRKG